MENIKYTTTNKCKSKVFLTNFSILLNWHEGKKKKFPPLMNGARESRERKAEKLVENAREREKGDLRAGVVASSSSRTCLVIIFGHRKSYFIAQYIMTFMVASNPKSNGIRKPKL